MDFSGGGPMSIVKIIRNESGETRQILNRDVANGDSYDVPAYLWFELYLNSEISDNVDTEDYVVNDGTQDLASDIGKKHLALFQPDSADSITYNNNISNLNSGNVQGAIDALSLFASAYGAVYAESENESGSSSSSFVQKVRLSVSDLAAGVYRIGWSFEYSGGSNNKDTAYRVQIDDTTTICEHEPRINKRDEWRSAAGFKYASLSSGNHYIDLDYRKVDTSAHIRRARLEIWRISLD